MDQILGNYRAVLKGSDRCNPLMTGVSSLPTSGYKGFAHVACFRCAVGVQLVCI